jgi:hypothetical protein
MLSASALYFVSKVIPPAMVQRRLGRDEYSMVMMSIAVSWVVQAI